MKTLIALSSLLFLTACASTGTPKDPCADRPIYKPYEIEVPQRPVLNSSTNMKSDGEVVRTVQDDMAALSSYAQQLENIIKQLPKNLSIPK